VVILIILLVSAVALPTVLPAINHRQVSEAARILQGALVGARDKAIHDGQPSGIRLLPDPAFPLSWVPIGKSNQLDPTLPLVYNRIVPIDAAPEYSEGHAIPIPVDVVTNTLTNKSGGFGWPIEPFHLGFSWPNSPYASPAARPGSPGLILCGLFVDPNTAAPEPPVTWFWNIRVGDKIQINGAGPWYTIIGPMHVGPGLGNSELFVNSGSPGHLTGADDVPSIVTIIAGTPIHRIDPVEYLILADGRDDNNNGWVDEGWDGVDNNGNGLVDELQPGVFDTINGVQVERVEGEPEAWQGGLSPKPPFSVSYTIRRRPAPSIASREIALPTSMVIDATTWNNAIPERSRLPVNGLTGTVDILVNPDGTASQVGPYGVPTSYGMADVFYHFWLAERQDLAAVQTTNGVAQPLATGAPYFLPIARPGGLNANSFPGPYLKGEYSVLTLFARTGQISTNANPPFLDQSGNYSPNNPFIQAEQGVRGGP
jgi:hypothetical protein